jgi:signal peptidase I
VERTLTSRLLPRGRRQWLRALNIGVTLVLAVFWWNLYRPQLIGGPAGYAAVEGSSMVPAYRAGDLVITREHSTYHVGEVIAFQVPRGAPGAGLHVIHRIIARTPGGTYVTMGDNRDSVDPWQLTGHDVIGSVAVHVPYVGAVVRVLREPPVFAWFVGSIVLVGLWAVGRRRRAAAAPRVS